MLSKAQFEIITRGEIVATGSIYGLEHYLADDPSSSSTTWKQTLEAISPRATCACISLRDMQACLGEDFLPVLIKRSRAYFYNLGRTSTITKRLDDISAASQSTEPTKLSLYQALRERLLANPVLPSTVSKILERVRWTQREHSSMLLEKYPKKYCNQYPTIGRLMIFVFETTFRRNFMARRIARLQS